MDHLYQTTMLLPASYAVISEVVYYLPLCRFHYGKEFSHHGPSLSDHHAFTGFLRRYF